MLKPVPGRGTAPRGSGLGEWQKSARTQWMCGWVEAEHPQGAVAGKRRPGCRGGELWGLQEYEGCHSRGGQVSDLAPDGAGERGHGPDRNRAMGRRKGTSPPE